MNRRESRISAFCLLFESDFHPELTYSEIYERAEACGEIPLSAFAKELYFTAASHLEEIDAQIAAFANNWSVSRMTHVARSITRLAAAELMYTEVPPKAAINEAVEIAKKYDDEKATAFINGVLNNIARSLGRITDNEQQ